LTTKTEDAISSRVTFFAAWANGKACSVPLLKHAACNPYVLDAADTRPSFFDLPD
jgi:hypothetical protein